MQTLKFKNKDEMPAFGLGTWKSEPGEVYNAVKVAIKEGYRHLDCAPLYGNEKEIGKALAESIAEGTVTRSEMWITSKLWNTYHYKSEVIPSLKQSLKDLQTDYLDLYLIHWPIALKKEVIFPQKADDMASLEDIPLSETWQAMEESVNRGLAKHLGVSNFGKKNINKLISTSSIKPEMNQVECHPYFQQEDLLNFCKSNDILFTAYAPLGSSDRPDIFKAKNEPSLLEEPVIVEIAKSQNATPAQILISWALHRGTSVIPKSVNPGRIVQNFQAQFINLSEHEMKRIAKLDRGYRYVTGQFWVFEGGPYKLEDVFA
ncbi:MAG TPA: aldehyde oxidoreductase [Prolixibacteraceae bacterium]|jgi:alcohol dehydrogenase (NADP+)|nr:aldehyde oxidoreductase [Prolixibacteraceae bacterium]